MPITLAEPIAGPVSTAAEIVRFEIDLIDNVARMTFSLRTDAGVEIRQQQCVSPLFTPQGAPRFGLQLYADIKATLYTLATEDGHIAGKVV